VKPYYDHDGIQIYHGNSEEIAIGMGRFDGLLTDPPYGIGVGAKLMGASKTRPVTNMILGSWDAKRPSQNIFDLFIGMTDRQVIWGGNYFADMLPPSRCWLVWHKRSEANGQTDFADAELAWTSLDANVRVIVHEWNGFRRAGGEDRYPHPTQKPVGVMTWALSLMGGGMKTILDPYMGSGSSLLACKKLRLQAVGIEAEERFCEMAALRLSQEVFDWGEA